MTQVLSDGTNTYTYGLGRITQTSATTEYFLGDALGSVRQLTNTAGEITYAKSYDPYGVVTQVSGDGQSAYGYTGESQDAASGMVYLRSRYYNAANGRFQSRDTWGGDDNNPITLNRWAYANANPILNTDPTGYKPCGAFGYFSNIAADYADENVNLPKTDWLNTYIAAGIGVQCWAESIDSRPINDSKGAGQITDKQKETPYGERIPDPKDPNNKDENAGFGLLCYIVYKKISVIDIPCTICADKDYMDKVYGEGNYKKESPHDQTEMSWAVEYMRRRIKLVIDACIDKKCGVTDIYIAAALAQNGPGFTQFNITKEDIKKLGDNERIPGVNMNWNKYFEEPGNARDTSRQLSRFTNVTFLLMGKGWIVPDINWGKVTELSGIGN